MEEAGGGMDTASWLDALGVCRMDIKFCEIFCMNLCIGFELKQNRACARMLYYFIRDINVNKILIAFYACLRGQGRMVT